MRCVVEKTATGTNLEVGDIDLRVLREVVVLLREADTLCTAADFASGRVSTGLGTAAHIDKPIFSPMTLTAEEVLVHLEAVLLGNEHFVYENCTATLKVSTPTSALSAREGRWQSASAKRVQNAHSGSADACCTPKTQRLPADPAREAARRALGSATGNPRQQKGQAHLKASTEEYAQASLARKGERVERRAKKAKRGFCEGGQLRCKSPEKVRTSCQSPSANTRAQTRGEAELGVGTWSRSQQPGGRLVRGGERESCEQWEPSLSEGRVVGGRVDVVAAPPGRSGAAGSRCRVARCAGGVGWRSGALARKRARGSSASVSSSRYGVRLVAAATVRALCARFELLCVCGAPFVRAQLSPRSGNWQLPPQ